MILYLVVSCIWTVTLAQSTASAIVRDYCLGDVFEPDCGTGVIVINYALYGRMKLGTCLTQGFGVIGCQSNVTDILNQECFAKTTCEILVSSDEIFDISTCGELRHYLEVSYTCIEVVTPPREACDNGDLLKITSPSPGHLSGLTSRDSGCGSRASPWLIQSQEGKNILLTLVDLTYTGSVAREGSICLVYAIIEEEGRGQSTTVCGGQSKESVVYRSVADSIRVAIVSRERQFLLKYEFVGCSAMERETGTIITRKGNRTTVRCENTGQTSTLTCDGAKWTGQLPNCTEPETVPDPDLGSHTSGVNELTIGGRDNYAQETERQSDEEEMVAFNFESITWGMVLIVIGIITGGIVACVFIISVVYLKRKTIECNGPILVPRPVSEAGYEVCDFDISQCTSSVYRDGYLTVPKDYTPMMNGTLPKYKKPDVWERPLPAEPNHV